MVWVAGKGTRSSGGGRAFDELKIGIGRTSRESGNLDGHWTHLRMWEKGFRNTTFITKHLIVIGHTKISAFSNSLVQTFFFSGSSLLCTHIPTHTCTCFLKARFETRNYTQWKGRRTLWWNSIRNRIGIKFGPWTWRIKAVGLTKTSQLPQRNSVFHLSFPAPLVGRGMGSLCEPLKPVWYKQGSVSSASGWDREH